MNKLLNRFATWLAAPTFPDDEEKSYQIALLNSLIIGLIGSMVVAVGIISLFTSAHLPTFVITGLTALILVVGKVLINRGRISGIKYVLPLVLWVNSTILVLFSSGTDNVSMIYYLCTAVIVTLLFGRRGAFVALAITAIATFIIAMVMIQDWMPARIFLTPPFNGWLILTLSTLIIIVTLGLAIDSRDRALRALRESGAKYRALFEAESDAILVIEKKSGLITEINSAAIRLYGYTREQLLNKSLVELSAEPEKTQVAVQAGPSHIPLRYHRRQDGRIFPAEINTNEFFLGGKVMQIGTIRDISERQRVAEHERTITQGLRSVIEAADELIRCDTLDDLFRRAVELGREKLSLERSAVFLFDDDQKNLLGTFGTDDHGQTTDERQACVPIEANSHLMEPNQGVWQIQHNNHSHLDAGQQIYTEDHWYASTLLQSISRPIGVFFNDANLTHSPPNESLQETVAVYCSLLGNIIERKKSETALEQVTHALRASEQRYRQSIEAAGAVPYVQEYASKMFSFIGENIFQLTGYSAEEITPSFWDTLVEEAIPSGESSGLTEKEAIPLARSGKITHWQCDYRIRTRLGESRWIMDSAIEIFDENDLAQGSIGILQDVTDRKLAEVEREKLISELETKNAELERFTYTVSHDLKAPLITIQGFLGYLERDAETGNMARLRTDIGRISDASSRMQNLLNDLLELSRIGRIVNPTKHIPFILIVEEALKLVEGQVVKHGVEVSVNEELPFVYGDSARLVEVMQNLIDNAAKFMGNQPNPRIEIGCQGQEDGFAVFFVCDNGIGIEPQYQQRVFGLFNKLDPKSEGTGVGLALVKRIIEIHKGQIWIDSKGNDSGSTFYFTLPVKPLES